MIDAVAIALMLLAPVSLAPLVPVDSPAAMAGSQAHAVCGSGEQVLFQCGMGARSVAVCAGRQSGQRYVQYRFGGRDGIELEYPRRRAGTGTLAYASTGYSGGGESQIGFRNGDYSYVVYSRTVRTGFGAGGNRPDFSAGLFVRRGGRVISRRTCDSPRDADLDLAAAARFLPEGDFVDAN